MLKYECGSLKTDLIHCIAINHLQLRRMTAGYEKVYVTLHWRYLHRTHSRDMTQDLTTKRSVVYHRGMSAIYYFCAHELHYSLRSDVWFVTLITKYSTGNLTRSVRWCTVLATLSRCCLTSTLLVVIKKLFQLPRTRHWLPIKIIWPLQFEILQVIRAFNSASETLTPFWAPRYAVWAQIDCTYCHRQESWMLTFGTIRIDLRGNQLKVMTCSALSCVFARSIERFLELCLCYLLR